MKKCTILALVAIMCCSVDADAQGFLKGLADKAKEKVEKKVEGAVGKAAGDAIKGKSKAGKSDSKANGKTGNSTQSDSGYGKGNGYTQTTHGVYGEDQDPFQIYVEELAAPVDPKDWSDAGAAMNVEADDVTFRSIEEAIKAFPPLPTVQQICDQDVAPVKARLNFSHGVGKLGEAANMNMNEAVELAKKKDAGKKGVSAAQRTQMDNGAAQIFAYMQKHGIDPEKMSDKEMEELVKKGIASGEIKLSGMGGGFAVDPGYTDEQEEAIGQVTAKVDAIMEKINEAAETEEAYNYNILNQDKRLKPLYAEIQASWLKSDACKQVYDIEKDIDKRADEYIKKHPDYGKGTVIEYPDFWVQGRKQQNAIIRKYNMEQAEKWRKVIQEIYDKYLPSVQEIPAVDKELEAVFKDKTDLIYNIQKQHLTSTLMRWDLMYQILLSRSYGAPLVSTVSEENSFAQFQ